MQIGRFFAAAFLALAFASCAPAPSDPFRVLSQAYANRDAAAAASAYTENGVVIYAYEGTPEERFEGRAAIQGSFQRFLDQFPAAQSLVLSFRFEDRSADAAAGVYQLRVGESDYYGRFDVSLEDGLFARDVSSDAAEADFEALPAP